MTTTPSAKLGLLLDSMDDGIDPFVSNFERLDYAAGAIWVNAGVVPTDAELWDGAIVAEKATGKVWLAQKNVGGTFDHIWLRYPFKAEGRITATTGVSSGPMAYIACNSLATGGKNDTGALVGGRIQIPIKGIYAVTSVIKWAASAAGNRSCSISSSAGDDDDMLITAAGISTNSLIMSVTTTKVYAAGEQLTVCGWQTSGGGLNVTGNCIRVSMIEPVQ